MPKRPDIYELLAAQQASATTTTQLHSALKSTYIDKSNVDFWSGVITVSRALQDSRTYGDGNLPIPETGTINAMTIANGANETIGPQGTEIFRIENIYLDGCGVALKNDDGISYMIADSQGRIDTPLFLSSTMTLLISNASGSEKNPSVAYFKMGL